MRFCLCFSASIIATSTILSYLAAADFAFANVRIDAELFAALSAWSRKLE